MTKAQKIANTVSAAPSSVGDRATMLNYPSKEGIGPEVLRPGTNGWSGFPDMPDTKGDDPMCMNGPRIQWIEAISHTSPVQLTESASLMLAPGGGWAATPIRMR